VDSKGTTHAAARSRATRLTRWPLFVSVVLHGLGLGGALWWSLHRATPPTAATIGSLALRPVEEEQLAVPDYEVVAPPCIEETFEFADALEQVTLACPPTELEPLFEDDADAMVHEPVTFHEVPLTAARGRRLPVPPPAPVVRPRPPAPRPRVVRLRPARRAPTPPPPRVAPSPVRRTPLRVVWAPDPRHYYPPAAASSRLSGRALVRLIIDARGRVTSARVVRTTGHALLDRAAVSLAFAYRFTTGPQARSTRLPVTFQPPRGGFGS